MLNNEVYYHGIIRNSIVAFGNLFSNIHIDRKSGGSVDGTTEQRIRVPLAYAPKEKWITRIEQDPNLENHTYISLPRMSFEIIGYIYDPARKMNKMSQITQGGGNNTAKKTFSPVPYTIDLSMYILSKTQEDGLQILEQILPKFTPDYTMGVKMTDMDIVTDIPIILNSVSVVDEYDGDFQQRRFVTHTLNFQMKVNLFGPTGTQGVIDEVKANIGQNEDFSSPNRTYVAEGDTTTATVSSESWEFNF